MRPCPNGAACKAAAGRIVEFVRGWKPEDGPLLLHCEHGVSRSTAAAFIALCAKEPGTDECALAARLRSAAPHAEPNLLLVDCADAVLKHEGRMVDAVLSLPDDPPPPREGCAHIQIDNAS